MELSLRVAERRGDLARKMDAAANAAAQVPLALRENILEHLAARVGTLGIRLSNLGRREEALAASQEAVDIYRLTAPMELEDGTRVGRTRGTPQGGVVSPVLANLFLHYAFDAWMTREHPDLPWCRYADDGLVHCRTEAEAVA
jgi:Reverse transcriptase (RNA-dependent DNA polymerase)